MYAHFNYFPHARVLFSPPWAFTVRILRTLFPCGYMEQMPNRPEMVSKIFKGTSYALRIIQKELGKMVWNVERAIIFGDDTEVAKIFPLFLGEKFSNFLYYMQQLIFTSHTTSCILGLLTGDYSEFWMGMCVFLGIKVLNLISLPWKTPLPVDLG